MRGGKNGGRPVHKIHRKDRICGGFITRHCYVHDGQWRSDISIQHFRFTDHSWSYVSNGPICSKSNTIQGLPFRNSRLGRGRRNGRTCRRQKQAGSFGETAKRNSLRIRPRTVGSKPAARRYRKGCEDIAGSAIARPSLISNALTFFLLRLLLGPLPSHAFERLGRGVHRSLKRLHKAPLRFFIAEFFVFGRRHGQNTVRL